MHMGPCSLQESAASSALGCVHVQRKGILTQRSISVGSVHSLSLYEGSIQESIYAAWVLVWLDKRELQYSRRQKLRRPPCGCRVPSALRRISLTVHFDERARGDSAAFAHQPPAAFFPDCVPELERIFPSARFRRPTPKLSI
jgi:hypothetical protein